MIVTASIGGLRMKVCKPIIALMLVIIWLAIIVFFQYLIINCLETDLESYKKPFLKGTNMGFSGDNFVGIVCNTGTYTAYNTKLVLYTDTWSYNISLGNIAGSQFVEFDEYVPTTPESGDVHNTYLIKYEYSNYP